MFILHVTFKSIHVEINSETGRPDNVHVHAICEPMFVFNAWNK